MTSEKMPRSMRPRVTSLVNHSWDGHFQTLHAIFHIFFKISSVMSTHMVQAFSCQFPIPPSHTIFQVTILFLGAGCPYNSYASSSLSILHYQNFYKSSMTFYMQFTNKKWQNLPHYGMLILISASAIVILTNGRDSGSSVKKSKLSVLD